MHTAAFLNQNEEIWSSAVSDAQGQELFRTALRLEVGLFDSAYDELMKREVTDGKIPDRVPLPGGGPRLTWRAVCDHGPPPLPNWDLCLGDLELF